MCVICVIKAGTSLPSRSELYAMHRQNPHGMGFCSKSMSYKGMCFDTFYNRLQFVPIDEDIIIHFRFATHGSVNVNNCHPFKRGNVWFAHNGILNIIPTGDKTDSQTAFDEILYPVIKRYGIDSQELKDEISSIIGYSKFAFLGEDGKVRIAGDYQRYQGRLYSNLRHLDYTPLYRFSTRFGLGV